MKDDTLPLATPARRILARALEGGPPMALGVALSLAGAFAGAGAVVRAGMWVALSLTLLMFLSNAYLLATSGQSVGKIALGLRVVRPDGSPAGLTRAFVVRELLVDLIALIPVLGAIFVIVDGVWLLVQEDRRALHDQMADTIVVDLRARTTLPDRS